MKKFSGSVACLSCGVENKISSYGKKGSSVLRICNDCMNNWFNTDEEKFLDPKYEKSAPYLKCDICNKTYPLNKKFFVPTGLVGFNSKKMCKKCFNEKYFGAKVSVKASIKKESKAVIIDRNKRFLIDFDDPVGELKNLNHMLEEKCKMKVIDSNLIRRLAFKAGLEKMLKEI